MSEDVKQLDIQRLRDLETADVGMVCVSLVSTCIEAFIQFSGLAASAPRCFAVTLVYGTRKVYALETPINRSRITLILTYVYLTCRTC